MLLTFSSEPEIWHAFRISMTWGALVVAITTVLMMLSLEGTKSEISKSTGAMLGLLFYLLFGLLTYREQFGSFTAAEVDAQSVTLHYAGSYFEPQCIDAGEIATIEAGHPGKGEAHQCYLHLTLRSGTTQRSAPSATADCETYRKQMETLLGR
ncbi:MAG: hypothetical protein AB1722_02410 [Pseudomonadota bacterium]